MIIRAKQNKLYQPVGNRYLPGRVTNPLIERFMSFRLGIFICYGMPTYNEEDLYTVNYTVPSVNPTVFAPPANIDSKVRGWVDFAVDSCEAEYVILTVVHNQGFGIYPFKTELNGGVQFSATCSSRGTVNYPQYSPYNVSSPLYSTKPSQTIVHSFCDQCNKRGVEPVLYYNTGKQVVAKGAHSFEESTFDPSGNYQDWYAVYAADGLDAANAAYPTLTGTYAQHYKKYEDYVVGQLCELVNDPLLNFKYLWLDAYRYTHFGLVERLYNTIKSISDKIVIANYIPVPYPGGSITPNGFVSGLPPYNFVGDISPFFHDISSIEYFIKPDDNAEIENRYVPHKGSNYYIPKELTKNTAGSWYWKTGLSVNSQSTVQGYYNFAKARGVPISLSLGPDQNGDIVTAQGNVLSGLTL